MMTTAASLVLIAGNLSYLPYLLKRPYISFRPSKKLGDPLNNAELFILRTTCWGTAILAIRDTAFPGDSYKWTIDIFCALLLSFLIWSQRPLFYGLNTDLLCRSLRSSSNRLSSASKRSDRAHSGANELGYGSQIKSVLETTSYRVVIFMQTRLRPQGMPEEERSRWTERVDNSTTAGCFRRWCCCCCCSRRNLLLLLILISLPLGMGWAATDFQAIKTAFVSLPTLLCVAIEALAHRVKRPSLAPARSAADSQVQLTTKSTRFPWPLPPAGSGVPDDDVEEGSRTGGGTVSDAPSPSLNPLTSTV